MKERVAFGKAIADHQGLRFMLAEMAMRNEAARTLVYRACSLIDGGDPTGELSMIGAMAKCFASDTAMAVTTDAVQLLGGTASPRTSRSSGSCAMPRSPRSTRAPTRSSGW